MGCNMSNKDVSLVNVQSGVGAEVKESPLQTLLDNVETEHRSALTEIRLALEEVAKALEDNAKIAADTVVAAEHADAKIEAVHLLRAEALRMRTLANGVWFVKSATELRDEIKASLLLMIEERANNIAQAYAGRVLPEVNS